MLDGLYGVRDVDDDVGTYGHWTKLFHGQWLASLFLSQDPIAIDSVGLDFLRTEFPHGKGNKPQAMINADDYLHEAALTNNPPSGTVYSPCGTRLKSPGVPSTGTTRRTSSTRATSASGQALNSGS